MRLAWFSPLPPTPSGIAAYSREILPLIRARAEVDVFDEPAAHDFLWKHHTRPYDLIVYQLGNAECHDFMWPYLTRFPGLVVLHDARLHQARALALLRRQQRQDDYRAEFRFNHPDARPEVAELVIEGRPGYLLQLWPMLGVAVSAARSVAVHNPRVAVELAAELARVEVQAIRMGVGQAVAPDGARDWIRARHGIPPDAIVFVAFGGVTPEKRVTPALKALARVRRERPDAWLMLVGEPAPHYDAAAEARALGIGRAVTLCGFVPDAEVAAYLAAADVCFCLRWPSSRETSASWLRALAAGKPTVITALADLVDVPSLDPRSWTALQGHATEDVPVAVGIDILDEDHSLTLAVRRLAADAALRDRLGRAALAYWRAHHTLELMADDYVKVMAKAMSSSARVPADLPGHLRKDGTELARTIANHVGVDVDFLSQE